MWNKVKCRCLRSLIFNQRSSSNLWATCVRREYIYICYSNLPPQWYCFSINSTINPVTNLLITSEFFWTQYNKISFAGFQYKFRDKLFKQSISLFIRLHASSPLTIKYHISLCIRLITLLPCQNLIFELILKVNADIFSLNNQLLCRPSRWKYIFLYRSTNAVQL